MSTLTTIHDQIRIDVLREAAAIAHNHVMQDALDGHTRRWHQKHKTVEWLISAEVEAIEREILEYARRLEAGSD